jgi:hypothetical protein
MEAPEMTLYATMAFCAVLCVTVLAWILRPIKNSRAFYMLAFFIALSALGLYVALGRPELPMRPVISNSVEQADYRAMVLREYEFMNLLSENPDNVDALIRLAALRVVQGRDKTETRNLLERAKELKPKDKRIGFIQAAMNAD